MIILALLSFLTMANVLPEAYAAWGLDVAPVSRNTSPGGTVFFTVSVTGTIPGNPNVMLLVSPPTLGITPSFSVNNVPAPFTSTMTVTVAGSKAPGYYDIPVWAHPSNVLFPGPGNLAFGVHVIVGASFDFNLALSPPSISVKQGDTASYQIFITYSDPSYSGTNINVQISGLGPGMDEQLVPSPPSLSIFTSQSTPLGNYLITLTGSALGVVRHTSAVLVVQAEPSPFDFSLSSSPTQQSITPGASTTYSIAVGLVSGASQNVALTVSSPPPSGVSTSLNPISGTPSFNSILSISTTSSIAPGQYAITITGSAGAITHTTTITLTIAQPPDFRIDVSPPSQTLIQGQTTSYSVQVSGLNGFNSQVSLTLAGLPSGVGGVFSVPSSTPDFSSTLSLTIPTNAPTGSFTLTITGSGGGITRVANVILAVNPSQIQSTTSQSGPVSTGGLLQTLQQNSLILMAALVLLVILFGVLAMKGRGKQTAPQQKTPSTSFCSKCGTENSATNDFCANCGNKLKGN